MFDMVLLIFLIVLVALLPVYYIHRGIMTYLIMKDKTNEKYWYYDGGIVEEVLIFKRSILKKKYVKYISREFGYWDIFISFKKVDYKKIVTETFQLNILKERALNEIKMMEKLRLIVSEPIENLTVIELIDGFSKEFEELTNAIEPEDIYEGFTDKMLEKIER